MCFVPGQPNSYLHRFASLVYKRDDVCVGDYLDREELKVDDLVNFEGSELNAVLSPLNQVPIKVLEEDVDVVIGHRDVLVLDLVAVHKPRILHLSDLEGVTVPENTLMLVLVLRDLDSTPRLCLEVQNLAFEHVGQPA